ncbi:hypothetical protein D3C76_1244620 [compost metagenome]
MNEEPVSEITLSDIKAVIEDLKGLVVVGNDQSAQLHSDIKHLSGQMDILNHSLSVSNTYSLYTSVFLIIIAAVLMFMLGYNITRR